MSTLRSMLRRINVSTSSLIKHWFEKENSRGSNLLQRIVQQWEKLRLDQAGRISIRHTIGFIAMALAPFAIIFSLVYFSFSLSISVSIVITIPVSVVITISVFQVLSFFRSRKNKKKKQVPQQEMPSGQNDQPQSSNDSELIATIQFLINGDRGQAEIYYLGPGNFTYNKMSKLAKSILILEKNSSIMLQYDVHKISEGDEISIDIDIVEKILKEAYGELPRKCKVIEYNKQVTIKYRKESYKVRISF